MKNNIIVLVLILLGSCTDDLPQQHFASKQTALSQFDQAMINLDENNTLSVGQLINSSKKVLRAFNYDDTQIKADYGSLDDAYYILAASVYYFTETDHHFQRTGLVSSDAINSILYAAGDCALDISGITAIYHAVIGQDVGDNVLGLTRRAIIATIIANSSHILALYGLPMVGPTIFAIRFSYCVWSRS